MGVSLERTKRVHFDVVHHGKLYHQCDSCEKSFVSKSSLARHKKFNCSGNRIQKSQEITKPQNITSKPKKGMWIVKLEKLKIPNVL